MGTRELIEAGINWDGTSLDTGAVRANARFAEMAASEKKVATSADQLTKALKMIGGALAVREIVNGLKSMYVSFEREQEVIGKVDRAMAGLGASAETAARARQLLDRASRQLGISEVTAGEAIRNLMVKSQDAEASVTDFGLALDVSAKFNMSLSDATNLVAKAMVGQFQTLGRAMPALKNWIKEHKELAGTAEGAALFLDKLSEATTGEADAMSKTATGQMKRLNELFDKMGEQVGRLMTGSGDTATGWKKAADAAERFLAAMERANGLPIIQKMLGGAEWMTKALGGQLNHVQVGGMDMQKDQLDAYNKTFGRSLGYRFPDIVVHPSDPGASDEDAPTPSRLAGKHGETAAQRKRRLARAKKARDLAYRGSDWAGPEQLPAFNENFSLDLNYDDTMPPRTGFPSTGRFADKEQMRANAFKAGLDKQRKDHDKFVQDVTGYAEQMFSGMFSNLGNGFDAVMKAWVQSFESAFADMASKKSTSWLIGALFGGGAAGGYVGAATDVAPYVTAKSMPYGQTKAAYANLMRRTMRG